MATVYLSTTGNDANTYAQAQNIATPWATPGKVQASAVTGDTVQMAAGTYTFVNIAFTKIFTWNGASLSNGIPTTIIDGANAAVYWDLGNGATQIFNKIQFSNIINVTFYLGAFYFRAQSNATFNSCFFKNIKNSATMIPANAVFGGDTLTAASATLTGCLFLNCYSTVSNSGNMMIYWTASSGSSVMTLTNCTIVWTDQANISSSVFRAGAANSLVLKNCIVANLTANSYAYFNGISPLATYSDNYSWTSSPAGTGNITSDPLFIDGANANFNLRPTSPCIGTGTL